jgi:hypothetical protein
MAVKSFTTFQIIKAQSMTRIAEELMSNTHCWIFFAVIMLVTIRLAPGVLATSRRIDMAQYQIHGIPLVNAAI